MKNIVYNKIYVSIVKKIFIILLIIFSLYGIKLKAATPSVYADSYILMESSSQRVLLGKNIDKRSLTASICKVLTAIIVIENCNINDYILVDKDAVNQVGSSIYLKENDLILIKDLLYGLLLRSGNDCAYLLSKHICNNVNEFGLLMNQYAKKIGMKNSTFTNPSGLDETTFNYSTPYDMAILMIYAMKNDIFRNIISCKSHISYTGNNQKLYFYNKHKLVQKYDYIIGGKTGFTEKAKRTLITYASKNGMELVCVTFNSGNDWNEHLNMFNYGFENFKLETLYKSQIINTSVILDYTPYLENDVILPISKSDNISIKIYLLKSKDKIKYKDSETNVVGNICIYNNDKQIYKMDIIRYY